MTPEEFYDRLVRLRDDAKSLLTEAYEVGPTSTTWVCATTFLCSVVTLLEHQVEVGVPKEDDEEEPS